ncbi:MAG: hypothetical protein QXH27_02030 [Candidatus Micrarchaeia archaeon]
MRPPRGQSTVEFLVILAVALAVLVVIIALSSEQITDVGKTRARADVRAAARDLATAANQVYLQGAGARKLVAIRLPAGYNASRSFITNNTIGINFEGSDYLATTDVDVVGVLPPSPGTHYLWVVAREGYVTIGPRALVFTPGLILVTATAANYSQSKTAYLNASNEGNESLNVTLALFWSEATVNVSFSNPADQNFGLGAGESKGIVFVVGINASAVGSYSGYIDANASNGESERIDFIVEVTPLTCVPASVPGAPGACRPTRIDIQTYLDALRTIPKKAFAASEVIFLTGAGWGANTSVTVDVRDPLNVSVAGFPQTVLSDSLGALNLSLDSMGLSQGSYLVLANSSYASASSSFVVTPCP